MLVANNSLIARALHQKQEEDQDSDDEIDIEVLRSQRRRMSLEATASVIRSKNKFSQDVVSPQSIFVLQIIKQVCGISDKKLLLLQFLSFYLFTGIVATPAEAKRLFITGSAFVHRARQKQYVIEEQEMEKINRAPGAKSLSSDDTDIYSTISSSRKIAYFNQKKNSPQLHQLTGKPSGRKNC